MITTVRRCDYGKCGKIMGDTQDYLVLSVAVTAHRNIQDAGGVMGMETPGAHAPAKASSVELCSPACAEGFVRCLVEQARA